MTVEQFTGLMQLGAPFVACFLLYMGLQRETKEKMYERGERMRLQRLLEEHLLPALGQSERTYRAFGRAIGAPIDDDGSDHDHA